MTASEPLRFHEFHGKDIILSRCHKRAMHDGDCLCFNTSMDDFETEVVYSRRPIQVGEMVPLHFGHFSYISSTIVQPRSSVVTLGFTENNPSTLSRVPRISQLERLPGYWVTDLLIHFGYRLQFSVDSLGVIHFSDSSRTWTGRRVRATNVSLWAVLSIPEHFFAEFDPEPLPSRALSNAVPVSSPNRGVVPVRAAQSPTHSIPSSSSQDPSTTHQSDHRDTGEREDTTRGGRQDPTGPECIICYNKPPDTALSPCGHMFTCHDCALDLWQGRGRGSCPTCRKQITSVLRVYKD